MEFRGIVRNNHELLAAQQALTHINDTIDVAFQANPLSKLMIETRNLACSAQLIVNCALSRKESRGLHYNVDYPQRLATAEDTLLEMTFSERNR